MSMLQPKSISCSMTELSGVTCTRKLSGLISAWIILTACMAATTRSISMQKWSVIISFIGRPSFCLIAFATSNRDPHGLKSDISTEDWSPINKKIKKCCGCIRKCTWALLDYWSIRCVRPWTGCGEGVPQDEPAALCICRTPTGSPVFALLKLPSCLCLSPAL